MPKAAEVATELRRVADALDKEPETVVARPMVVFYCNSYLAADKGKSMFLALVKLLPRPLAKIASGIVGFAEYELENKTPGIWLRCVIDRSSVCTLVEPAKPAVYECEPLLSADEEASLETAQ